MLALFDIYLTTKMNTLNVSNNDSNNEEGEKSTFLQNWKRILWNYELFLTYTYLIFQKIVFGYGRIISTHHHHHYNIE